MISNLNRIEVFCQIYRARGIQAAAEENHVSRSALSQTLKLLEDELGQVLFSRSSKHFSATSAGESLYQEVAPLMDQLRNTLLEASQSEQQLKGRIKIGSLYEFGRSRVVEMVSHFSKKHPDVEFDLSFSGPPNVVDKLCRGDLHFGFIDDGEAFAKGTPIHVKTVASEKMELLASAKLAKTLADRSYANLAQQPFIDYVSFAPVAKRWFKHHFGKAPSRLSAPIATLDVRAVIQGLLLGMGFGVVPIHLAEKELNSGKLVVIKGKRKPIVQNIQIGFLPDPMASPTEKAFKEHAIEYWGLREL